MRAGFGLVRYHDPGGEFALRDADPCGEKMERDQQDVEPGVDDFIPCRSDRPILMLNSTLVSVPDGGSPAQGGCSRADVAELFLYLGFPAQHLGNHPHQHHRGDDEADVTHCEEHAPFTIRARDR